MTTKISYTTEFANPSVDIGAHRVADELFSEAECISAQQQISQWDGYAATPLLELHDIAKTAGVNTVFYKDESSRFGLGSFKALGGSYAIAQLAEGFKKADKSLTAVSTATDGNHGRSVAWGAQQLGVECHIFLHKNVSQSRANAMAAYGANIHWVDGNYDDSIAACIELSASENWQIVSDTSWGDYREIPRQVMIGYTVMAAEIIEQLGQVQPTHIILPAGCGGLAGAMIAYFWQHYRDALPKIIIVESDKSDCVYQSLSQEKILLVDIVDETVMAGLSCGEVSQLAWPLLHKATSHVITIDDSSVAPMMRRMANGTQQQPSIEAGECSVAGIIAILAVKGDQALAERLEMNSQSKILVFGTEGATDPLIYESIINSANQV